MLSRLFGAVCLLAIFSVVVDAEDYSGKVKKVDQDKNTITLTVADKDQTLTVSKDTKYVALFGKKLKKATLEDLPGGLSAIKEGVSVTITTEKKDNNEVATQVKLAELQAKKKKKATN